MGRLSLCAFLGFAAAFAMGDLAANATHQGYNTWRTNFGRTGLDCNADGKVDAADYVVWRSRFDAIARANSANVVLAQWKGADLDCSGTVDAADYVVWRKTLHQ
jgi:hypothetical protein